MNISASTVIKQIRTLFIPYMVILMACLVILAMFTKAQIYFTVNSWHFTFGDSLFAWFTNVGDGMTAVGISLLFLLFSFRKGFLIASSYIITSVVAQSLKFIFATARPIIFFKDQLSRIYLVKGVDMLETHSFPSGHTVSAFSAAVVLTYITPKKSWGVLFLGIALMVGYSRMYLSEHFFEDVTGGSAIGVFVTILWLTYIDSKPFLHSPKWKDGILSLRKPQTAS